MSDTLSQTAVPADVESETALKQISAETDYLNEKMDRDRNEIERLQAETHLLKVETRAILAALGVGI